ncbi:hypothetical protein HME7025_00080 [Aquirufa nivalisilvae]|uniref:Uncharacterized protein n=1 Tax=Aquirufa nivalisilvae TaxID=2516557 RepID=A0A2S2DRG0_9BACT|nr:hypothetical protein [Aquirufa nivalisilvae]AWL07965.1 hypothetical protein HME7025_00080 [Aquirufa nivalisilvae]
METRNFESWSGLTNGKQVKDLFIFNRKYLESIDANGSSIRPGGLRMAHDTIIYNLKQLFSTCIYSENVDKPSSGAFSMHSFNIDVPAVNSQMLTFLRKQNLEYCAIFRDGNEVLWFCDASLEITIKKTVADKNSNQIILSGPATSPAYMMDDVSLEDIMISAEFSNEFSTDFNS